MIKLDIMHGQHERIYACTRTKIDSGSVATLETLRLTANRTLTFRFCRLAFATAGLSVFDAIHLLQYSITLFLYCFISRVTTINI